MQTKCPRCGLEAGAEVRLCSKCGCKIPRESCFHKFGGELVLLAAFLICCAVCFLLLSTYSSFSAWVSVLLSVSIVLAVFVVVIKFGVWADRPSNTK